jgi:CPA2 family monovalent cation:H+ antiporter-2
VLGVVGPETGRVYLELGAVVLALGLGASLAARLELSPIGFYLLAGLVLGALDIPQLSGEFVEFTANLGVILLLFLLGLEYTAQELTEHLRRFLAVGVLDAVLNFVPGVAFGLLLGWEPLAAVLLGGVTWVSSSGIIAKALTDLGWLGNRETPAVLAVLVMEDLAMTMYLPLVASLLVGGGVLATLGSVAAALAAAAAALVLALRYGAAVGRLVEHPSEEAVLLTALGLVLLVAGVAEQLQVSAGVGAFLVGIALSGEVAHRTRALLAPIRDFNAALFFLFFALQIETDALPEVAAPALALAVVTAASKILTGWLGAARAGVGARGRARAGLALVPRGEFSIVIAGLGVGAGLEPQLAPLAAAYVLLLALLAPVLMRFPEALLALWRGDERRDAHAGQRAAVRRWRS